MALKSFEDSEDLLRGRQREMFDAFGRPDSEDLLRGRQKKIEEAFSGEPQDVESQSGKEIHRIQEILEKLNSSDGQEVTKGDGLLELETIYSARYSAPSDVPDQIVDRVMELRKAELFEKFGSYSPGDVPTSWTRRLLERMSGEDKKRKELYEFVRDYIRHDICNEEAKRSSLDSHVWRQDILNMLKVGLREPRKVIPILRRPRKAMTGEEVGQEENLPKPDEPQGPNRPNNSEPMNSSERSSVYNLRPDVVSRLIQMYGECPEAGSRNLRTAQGTINGIFVDCDGITAFFETSGGMISVPFEDLISSHGETYKKEKDRKNEDERMLQIRRREDTKKR